MVITFISVMLFAGFVEAWGEESAESIPAGTYLLMLGVLFWPFKGFFQRERLLFLRTMQRIALGGLGSTVFFADVILADILTSFSRVVGDLQIVFTDLDETRTGEQTAAWVDMIAPSLICLPFLFRLRQSRNRHMLNALKYLSALPVIASSWLINFLRIRYYGLGLDPSQFDGEPKRLFEMQKRRVWIFFSILNSVFSLYWDIRMDWHLGTIGKFNSWRSLFGFGTDKSFVSSPTFDSTFSTASSQQQRRGTGKTSAAYGKVPTDEVDVEAEGDLSKARAGVKVYPPSSVIKTPSSLALMANERTSGTKFFLRLHLHFRHAWLYYGAVVLDTILRLSWIVKVTLIYTLARASLRGQSGTEPLSGLMAVDFTIKCLEIVRRYVWVFFRCEREWVVRKGHIREDPAREVRVPGWEAVGIGMGVGNFVRGNAGVAEVHTSGDLASGSVVGVKAPYVLNRTASGLNLKEKE
ncbi:EXS family-domain-containing protein [Chytridium lagenaria]|nr:EXS family-domain-containing protein [Chytridium lagenaria]